MCTTECHVEALKLNLYRKLCVLSLIDNDPRLLHPSHRVAPYFARTILYLTVPYLHLLHLLSNHLTNGAHKPLVRVLSWTFPFTPSSSLIIKPLSHRLSHFTDPQILLHTPLPPLLSLPSSPITPPKHPSINSSPSLSLFKAEWGWGLPMWAIFVLNGTVPLLFVAPFFASLVEVHSHSPPSIKTQVAAIWYVVRCETVRVHHHVIRTA